jgi:hypothetical protein
MTLIPDFLKSFEKSNGSLFYNRIKLKSLFLRLKDLEVTKKAIIQKTVEVLNMLPANKAQEVSDFADFVLKKYENLSLQRGIEMLQSQSEAFSFLNDDEDLYSPADIKKEL